MELFSLRNGLTLLCKKAQSKLIISPTQRRLNYSWFSASCAWHIFHFSYNKPCATTCYDVQSKTKVKPYLFTTLLNHYKHKVSFDLFYTISSKQNFIENFIENQLKIIKAIK